MSKQAIAGQIKTMLVTRNRYLRSGTNNVIKYMSVWFGYGPQTAEIAAFLADPPPWLYVERDGRRVTRIGLTAWLEQPQVEDEVIPDDIWSLVGQLFADNARLKQELTDAQQEAKGYKELCEQLTDPSFTASEATSAVSEAAVVELCDHESITTELEELRTKVTRLQSAAQSKRNLIESQREARNAANTKRREVEKDLRALQKQYKDTLVGHLMFVMAVLGARRFDRRIIEEATRQLRQVVSVLQDLGIVIPRESQAYLEQIEARLSA